VIGSLEYNTQVSDHNLLDQNFAETKIHLIITFGGKVGKAGDSLSHLLSQFPRCPNNGLGVDSPTYLPTRLDRVKSICSIVFGDLVGARSSHICAASSIS
jgi:hypothetical protein